MASHDPQDERTVRKDGYELTFYPGFASRATIRAADGTQHELFRQTETYRLPHGKTRPDGRHVLRLRGGTHKQNIRLAIDDPELRIARITIELYDGPHPEGSARPEGTAVERFEVENDPKTCPPSC